MQIYDPDFCVQSEIGIEFFVFPYFEGGGLGELMELSSCPRNSIC